MKFNQILPGNKKDSIITSIDDDNLGYYQVSFKANYESIQEEESSTSPYRGGVDLTREGLEALFKLFYIVKAEMNFMDHLRLYDKDVTSRINEVLWNYFWNEAENGEDLEYLISQNIDKLKLRKYLTCDLHNNFPEIEIEDIILMIQNMRGQQIDFYEAILSEYLKNTDKYNESLELSPKKEE